MIPFDATLRGRDIIVISSIEWESNWQVHQEVARRLSQAGNRVLFIENLGVRAPGLRDARRVVSRGAKWLRSLPGRGVRQVSENLYVCSPLVLPPFGSAASRLVNRRVLLPLVRRAVRTLGFRCDVVLTYLPTDTAMALIELLRKPTSLTVYYCLADFTELTAHPEAMVRSERTLVERSDVVLAQCQELAERCAPGRTPVGIFPSGVDMDLFSSIAPSSVASRVATLPRPVIGYVGGIHRHFDVEMVAAMAAKRPEWSWVLIGPAEIDLSPFVHLPNVHVYGPKAHEELPDYVRSFDVGIVPYRRSKYTDTVVPTKIHEYLAMGKPVVSTDLPEVTAFNKRHEVLITSPNQPGVFLSAIEQALLTSSGEHAIHRRDVAALHDWSTQIERMSRLIASEAQLKSATLA